MPTQTLLIHFPPNSTRFPRDNNPRSENFLQSDTRQAFRKRRRPLRFPPQDPGRDARVSIDSDFVAWRFSTKEFAQFGIACAKSLLLVFIHIFQIKFMSATQNNFPKLHNAMWPGLVGKGSPGAEPSIDLDTMLDLTAKAEVNGVKFDGVDLFLYDPHVSIDIDDSGIKKLADKIRKKGFDVGSVVAPVWFDGVGHGRRRPSNKTG